MSIKTAAEIAADIERTENDMKAALLQLRIQLRDTRIAEAKAAEKAALVNSDRERWMRATRAARKDGVKFKANVVSCCRGCVDEAKLGLTTENAETQPYAWTFAGQGNRISWDGSGTAIQKLDTWSRQQPPVVAYINHGNGAAPIILAALVAEGLDASWDGKESSCVIVKF